MTTPTEPAVIVVRAAEAVTNDARLAAVEADAEEMRRNYEGACKTVALMHAAVLAAAEAYLATREARNAISVSGDFWAAWDEATAKIEDADEMLAAAVRALRATTPNNPGR